MSIRSALALVTLVTACGGDDAAVDAMVGPDSDPVIDAPFGTPDAGPPDAFVDPPDAGPCNMLVNSAPEITRVIVAMTAPTPTGGTILDGTYYLTESIIYNPAAPPGNAGTAKSTMVISGNQIERVTLSAGVDDPENATFVTSNETITATKTCPTMTPLGWDWYTVNGDELIIQDKPSPDPPVLQFKYVRQP